MNFTNVSAWVAKYPPTPIHIDCITAVMLKILDGKCKMNSDEKIVMAMLYQSIKDRPGKLLTDEVHSLIKQALDNNDEALKNRIYEQRLLAETMISRPVMKGFKSMIRERGLFPQTV